MSSQSREKYLKTFASAAILCSFLLSGCNAVRYVPDQKFLLIANKIESTGEGLSRKELSDYFRQQPNKKIFGVVRFHLGIYNLSNPDKNNWLNNWLRNIGEEPVIYNPAAKDKTVTQLRQFLINKGYHHAHVSDSVVFSGKNAEVIYRIDFGKPYIIDQVNLADSSLVTDAGIRNLVRSDSAASLLKPGMRFDQEVLRAERNRLAKYLQDKGYYGFSREYIYFLTDTLAENLTARVGLGIKNPKDFSTNPMLTAFHPLFRIGDISIVTDFNTSEYLKDPASFLSTADTLNYEGVNLIYNNRLYMKPSLLQSSVMFKTGSLFSQTQVDKTIESFSSLRNFKQIKVSFAPGDFLTDSVQKLDCQILLAPVTKQSYDLALEGTYSSGNIGMAGNLIYKHRNLLRGAEYFELKLKGAVEFLADAIEDFNRMLEFGVDARMDVPRSWIPFASGRTFTYGKPHSSVSLSYNYQQRPDFTRTIANAAYGYNWSRRLTRHQISVLDFNLINVTKMSDKFYSIIQGTAVENSFRSHVVHAVNYTFTLSEQEINKESSFFYIRIRPELAGNVLFGLSRLGGNPKPEDGYVFLGTPFSQYVEADMDLRYHWVWNKSNRMAFRLFTGVGYPYGNSDAMPFEKKYFSGGSSGIRAWQVRSLGPGSYVMPEDQVHLYPNQLGDVKLEANVEYRFDLFSVVKGAVFLDAGNIWAISETDERPGAVFKADTFLSQIAVGTGFGLRADLSYFIGRLDLGIKLRDPGAKGGPQWIPVSRKFTWQDFVLNFGIGYPF